MSAGSDLKIRALVVKLGQIGDVIMAIPAAHALHSRGFDIDWICGQAVKKLLECYSWINVIAAEDKAIVQGNAQQRAGAIVRLWRVVTRNRYDLCATLYYDRRYQLLTLPVRAKRKLVLSRSSRATTLLPGRHHTDEYARVLLQSADSCRDQSLSPIRPDRLPPSPWPVKTAPRRIVIVPGAANSLLRQHILGLGSEGLRRWPIENFVALAKHLLDRSWEVILLGGPNEAWVRPYFEGMAIKDALGTLSLPEVVSACDSSDAVISNDTGPLHLAGLSDTCLIGIFGPTDPATRIPRRSYTTGLWGGQGFACRPCYDGVDFAPCQFNGCMHQVTPAMVLRELDKMLHARSQGMDVPWRVALPEEDASIYVEITTNLNFGRTQPLNVP